MDNYTPSTPCIPLPAAGLRELIRGRLFAAEGASTECRSQLQPRYQRRTRRVNEAIVGCYLAGANSRRIRRALAPLLGTESLSKSAISRLVQTLKTHFEAWQAVIARLNGAEDLRATQKAYRAFVAKWSLRAKEVPADN